MKEIIQGIKSTWGGAGLGPFAVAFILAIFALAWGGKTKISKIVERGGFDVNSLVAVMPDFSPAWAFLPLLILVLYGTGKIILRLRAELAELENDREKAFVELSEEHNKFIDSTLNRDPPDNGIDQWLRDYVKWRNETVVPLVARATSQARANLFLYFGGRITMNNWNPNRSFQFNHSKSMMVQTLNEIWDLVREQK